MFTHEIPNQQLEGDRGVFQNAAPLNDYGMKKCMRKAATNDTVQVTQPELNKAQMFDPKESDNLKCNPR